MAEKIKTSLDVPQVISIVPVRPGGKVSLKKDVRTHLGAQDGELYLEKEEEILLTTRKTPCPADARACNLQLPEEVLAALELEQGDLLALIQRDAAVALKKMEVLEQAADRARVIDYETPLKVERVAETTPMPDALLPALKEKFGNLRLKHSARDFLRARKTLGAWKARRLLGMSGSADERLCDELIRERLDSQQEDGSWEGDIVLTARNLRELAELELKRGDAAIDRGADWLLQRSQSPWNPGMFFLTDELVAEQDRIVTERQEKNGKGRFRELRPGEMRRVAAGDDLISMPCGPRIMWPNALALEALLALGYQDDERVRTALDLMLTHDWCECGYGHGVFSWRQAEVPDAEKLERFEQSCIGEYRYGGIAGIQELGKMDLTKKTGTRLLRVARAVEGEADVYPLGMPIHFQGCEVITTRAMRLVEDEKMRKFTEAHLWRFASRQHAPDGAFTREKHGYCENYQPALLQVFAGYDHPASKVAAMRSLPWIVEAQNEDGSWGEEHNKDAATFAVLSALALVGDYLPSGLVP